MEHFLFLFIFSKHIYISYKNLINTQPSAVKKEKHQDDITDFPLQKSIPMPENRAYQEGKYKPSSVPVIAGYSI
jgi:hypothetical protein